MPLGRFSPESVAFLQDLRANNNKFWFEQHRYIYETCLLEPFRQLSARLGPTLRAINPAIETRPQVGKTISRIYRDTRFSQNKLPLRDHLWLEFRDRSFSGQDTPQFFFYLEVEEWGYGMGFWQASTAAMEGIRSRLAAQPSRGQKIFRELKRQNRFILGGEKFRRPRQADLPAEVLELYNYRSFFYICRQSIGKSLFAERLAEEVAEGFQILGPVYRYVVGI